MSNRIQAPLNTRHNGTHRRYITVVWLLSTAAMLSIGVFVPLCQGSPPSLTVQDVLAGIESRQSRVRDCTLEYTITNERTKELGDLRQTRLQAQIAKDPDNPKLKQTIAEEMPLVSEHSHLLKWAADKALYVAFDTSTNGRSEVLRGAYANGTLRQYWPKQRRGNVDSLAGNYAVPFETVADLLSIEDKPLLAYLRNPDIRVELYKERVADNGDIIVTLRSRRDYHPKIDIPEWVVGVEYQIEINASRDFWPQAIVHTGIIEDQKRQKSVRVPQGGAVVEGFIEENGTFYPKCIKVVRKDSKPDYETGSWVPVRLKEVTLETKTLTVTDVRINRGVPDSAFELKFPDGTVVYDKLTRLTQTVGAPVEQLAKEIADRINVLSVSKYSREEAMRILQSRQAGGVPSTMPTTNQMTSSSATTPRTDDTPMLEKAFGGPVQVPMKEFNVLPWLLLALGAGAGAILLLMRRYRLRRGGGKNEKGDIAPY